MFYNGIVTKFVVSAVNVYISSIMQIVFLQHHTKIPMTIYFTNQCSVCFPVYAHTKTPNSKKRFSLLVGCNQIRYWWVILLLIRLFCILLCNNITQKHRDHLYKKSAQWRFVSFGAIKNSKLWWQCNPMCCRQGKLFILCVSSYYSTTQKPP